jgi:hypothetical protein
VAARGRLCRQDFAGRKTGKHTGRAANQIRSHYQSDHCQALGLTIPETFLLRANELIE